ncbi:hypothetical protein [Streptococcus himalayensis]|uniref:Lipoprotein n=1 Tax=Streptococcus himalayensis TaxID=1888195 RepID=A0A917A3D1_9STRE|nr:hypothetical protein [Streptococcus himalayensis]GGE24368.1 hypothetical protein GCM10011510_01850 [Streptococcus himalayensis]
MTKKTILSAVTLASVALLLTACEQKATESNSSNSSSIEQSMAKSKDKKSSQSSSSEMMKNKKEDVQDTDMKASASSSEQEGSSAEEIAAQSSKQTQETGKGGYEAKDGGTLPLFEDTPVYTAMDKGKSAGFTLPVGEVNWDQYMQGNGDYWYSYVGNDGVRYYIAYSDVGH